MISHIVCGPCCRIVYNRSIDHAAYTMYDALLNSTLHYAGLVYSALYYAIQCCGTLY